MPKRYVDENAFHIGNDDISKTADSYVRLIRYKDTWRAVETFSGKAYCLEVLALSKSYRVSAVCSALKCSERYLYSVFMRDIGLPPKTWMSMERMVVARRKLEGGKAIEMVARELGFMAVETFTRRFYEVHGISPGRFVKGRKVFDPSNEMLGYSMAASSAKSRDCDEEE